jgi:hypothetical protein
MSKTAPVVLFIGDFARAEALRETIAPAGWTLFHSDDLLNALAMQVFYYPDCVVIEGDHDDANEAYAHLRSIHVEAVIVLSDAPASWNLPPAAVALPTDSLTADLITALIEMIQPAALPALELIPGV